jgi:hypothetical protein
MKTHLTRLRVIVAVALAGGVCHLEAAAQYLPSYRPAPQTAPPYGYTAPPQQGQFVPQTTPQTYAPYQPQQQMVAQGQYAYPPAVQQQQQYPAVAQSPSYAQNYRYPMVAQQGPQPQQLMPNQPVNGQPIQGEVLPNPQNSMAVPTGQPVAGVSGEVYHEGHEGHVHGQVQGYPQTNGGNYAPYPATGQYGSYAGCNTDYGLSGYCDPACDTSNQWFGGIYFLFMERDNPGYTRITVQADPPTDPYYPPAGTTVISTANVDHDYREGLELRFGSTFSISSHDPCNGGCGSCSTDLYAWEFVAWAIDNDIEWFTVTDLMPTDTYRMYGMVNHAGLEYASDGVTYRPVNDYYDYQMPIVDDMPPVDGDVRVLAQRVRTNFRASNLELNLLRIPVCNVGCAPSNVGYSNCGYDSCGTAGYGGCAPAACAPAGPAFTMAGLCGIRYFRMRDAMEIATEFGVYDTGALDHSYDGFENGDHELFHDINVDNDLVGFQLGANMNYCVACKWNFFMDSNFGLYNNHMDQYQRVYAGNGMPVRFVQTGDDAAVRSTKDDLAFLGEMRLGGAYDLSCNWRAVLAYRAVAISGVALSNEQIKPEMSSYADVARIDSSSSIIIHGVQAGVECRY